MVSIIVYDIFCEKIGKGELQMKKESTSKKLLFAITLLFSLVIGFGMNKAQAAAPEQIPGDYTAMLHI